MAKRFFFGCAAMLMLAMAFQLGATLAHGQAAGNEVVDIAWRRSDGYAYAITKGGEIWANPGSCGSWSLVGHMPAGCVPSCMLDGDVGGSLDIGCENGDFYNLRGAVPAVTVAFCSSFHGAPVPGTAKTWGEVKARYR